MQTSYSDFSWFRTYTYSRRLIGANVSSLLKAPGAKDSGSVLWHLKDALEGFHQGCKTSECMGLGDEPRQWNSGLTLLLAMDRLTDGNFCFAFPALLN